MDAPDEPPPRDALATAERVAIVALFLAMTVVGCIQILNRHGLQLPVWNLEQLLPHFFVAITFLGMSMAYRHRAHLAVEIVPELLPPRVRRWYRLALWIVTAAFLAVLGYTAADVMAFQLEIGAVTTMGYPAALLTATLVCGAVLSLWRVWRIEIAPLLRGGR